MAKRLTGEQDAFGHAVWDHYRGTNALSPAEMETLLEGTGWRVAKRYEVDGARFYAAVIERVD